MRGYVSLVLFSTLLLSFETIPARGLTLTGGKVAKFFDNSGTEDDKAIIKFSRDLAIVEPLPIADCPNQSSLRLVTDRHDIGVVPLGCSLWRPIGNGFKYIDKEGLFGGVQKILIEPTSNGGTLLIKLKGDNYGLNAINDPVDYVEAHLTIGATEYCGRFEAAPSKQKKSGPNKVIFKGPSTACVPPTPTHIPTSTPTSTPTPTATAAPVADQAGTST
jgi:hypothetical protein